MQLELGQLIIDTQEDLNDIGVVVEVEENDWGDRLYLVYWTCKRPERRDYTVTLAYTQEEIDNDAYGGFEVIEKRT
jgi:hypothetical protein